MFETINVLAMNVATQAALSLVPSRRTTAIMMNSRDCASHTVLSSGLRLKKSILFREALSFRERMTKILFETLNVPATYVANQGDSFLYAALAPPTMFSRWCFF